jgi:hypothetical protein
MAKKECERSEIDKKNSPKKTFQNRSFQSSTAKGDRVRPEICFIILFFVSNWNMGASSFEADLSFIIIKKIVVRSWEHRL